MIPKDGPVRDDGRVDSEQASVQHVAGNGVALSERWRISEGGLRSTGTALWQKLLTDILLFLAWPKL